VVSDDRFQGQTLSVWASDHMMARRSLKLTHVVSTIWFVVCVGYIVVVRLLEEGFNWWLIFSLSGHSAVFVFVLVSLYLFAIVRDVSGTQHIAVEHPFTSTHYYMVFYAAAPLLGGLAGVGSMAEVHALGRFALGIAMGTLGTTFGVWVVLDPAMGVMEMLLPSSRRHRTERLARTEAQRKARQQNRERLLANALTREEREHQRWREMLQPQAERLAALLANDVSDSTRAEQEAVDIGAQAWQLGGLNCMRQLRDMTMAITTKKKEREPPADYVSYWWDGVGDWRSPSPE
jgi:hypothetical protein